MGRLIWTKWNGRWPQPQNDEYGLSSDYSILRQASVLVNLLNLWQTPSIHNHAHQTGGTLEQLAHFGIEHVKCLCIGMQHFPCQCLHCNRHGYAPLRRHP